MRIRIALALGLLLTGIAHAETAVVRYVDFEAPITSISALRITRAIDDAEAHGDALVLIRLDTPGGLVDAMERVVKRMLSAEVPIVVWVGPSGAKAASAGFFLLIAADVAAMAPGTRTGAASTVFLGGENREDDVLLKKANQDSAALLRSIADRRGRNAEVCEQAVFDALAWEEGKALEQGLIDLVASDRDALMAALDGREIRRFDGSLVVLRSDSVDYVVSEFSLRHEFMEMLATPLVASLLLMIGVLGLYIEFSNPGTILPGAVGAVCLLLFAMTAQVLPVSVIGLLLILVAIVLFVLEIKVASYGMLTLGGTVSLALGAVMLIEGPIPELRVPPMVVLPVAIALAAVCALVVRLTLKAQRAAVATGREGLTREVGTVVRELEPEGKVRVHGEIWNATSLAGPLPKGARVSVVEVDEMHLKVKPLEPTSPVEAEE